MILAYALYSFRCSDIVLYGKQAVYTKLSFSGSFQTTRSIIIKLLGYVVRDLILFLITKK